MAFTKITSTRSLAKIRTARDTDLAGGIFNFNKYTGAEGTGPGNTIFTTTRRFVVDDNSLVVYRNGLYQYLGIHYTILDAQTIQFSVPSIPATDNIVLMVNGGTILRDNSVNNSNNLVQLAGDLYKTGAAALSNSGNKFLAANYSIQGLLAPVKAVVGFNGTHTDLQTAINDVPAGSLILLDTAQINLSAQVNVNKADLTIMGVGRGSIISGGGFAGSLVVQALTFTPGIGLGITQTVQITMANDVPSGSEYVTVTAPSDITPFGVAHIVLHFSSGVSNAQQVYNAIVSSALASYYVSVSISGSPTSIMTFSGSTNTLTNTASASFVGLNVTTQGVKIRGIKFQNFSTAIKLSQNYCMVVENYFYNNVLDVDFTGVSKFIIESNIEEP